MKSRTENCDKLVLVRIQLGIVQSLRLYILINLEMPGDIAISFSGFNTHRAQALAFNSRMHHNSIYQYRLKIRHYEVRICSSPTALKKTNQRTPQAPTVYFTNFKARQ